MCCIPQQAASRNVRTGPVACQHPAMALPLVTYSFASTTTAITKANHDQPLALSSMMQRSIDLKLSSWHIYKQLYAMPFLFIRTLLQHRYRDALRPAHSMTCSQQSCMLSRHKWYVCTRVHGSTVARQAGQDLELHVRLLVL